MYGRTNKHDATRQIGQHVRRLERAQLADDRQKHTTGGTENIDQDMEKHYKISKSRRDPVNVYTYVYANDTDPSFNVCDCVP